MPDIIKINIDGTEANIADYTARNGITNLESITSLLASHSTDWINAIDYGFSTTSLNDSIMQSFIQNHSDKVLFFPNGTYKFNSGFNFDDEMHIVLSGNATLKLVGSSDYFITLRRNSTRSDYTYNSFITGGIIDGNYKCKTIFGCSKTICTVLFNTRLTNTLDTGIRTNASSTNDGLAYYSHIVIENTRNINETEETGTVGIFDNGLDNKFDNIEIINLERGVYTINGTFENIHAWIRSKNLIKNSQGFYCAGYGINLSNITIDSILNPFVIEGGTNYGLNLNNLNIITNENVLNASTIKELSGCIFNWNTDFGATVSIKCNNATIEPNYKFTTSTYAPLSSFINIRPITGTLKDITNIRSDDLTYTTSEFTVTTDQYGQASIPNLDKAYAILPLRRNALARYVTTNVIALCTFEPNGTGGSITNILANEEIKMHVLYYNTYKQE